MIRLSRKRINGAATGTHRFTRERLGGGGAGADCAAMCRRLARELDEAVDAAKRDGVPVACAPGCDFCCHLRVSVFAHEAAAVLHYMRTRLAPADAAAVERGIVEHAQRIDGLTVAQHYAARLPCALLIGGRCSVYEVRPSACAAHHSLSRSRCEHAFEHPRDHGTPKNSRPASLELQTLGDAMIAATQSALEASARPAVRYELHQCLRDLLSRRGTADDASEVTGDTACGAHST